MHAGREGGVIHVASHAVACGDEQHSMAMQRSAEPHLCPALVQSQNVHCRPRTPYRQGVARALLQAAEAATCSAGLAAISLHVRAADGPAQALYAAAKYTELDREKGGLLGGLIGGSQRPRILMQKDLGSAS